MFLLEILIPACATFSPVLLMMYSQFSSVQPLNCVRLFVTPWIIARQASLSITNSRSSLRLRSVESVMPSSHLILGRPLLLLPSIPPSIRVFSNESTLCMRWPKYYAQHIMWNVGLDEAQAGMKIPVRNINNLRYVDDTTLMAESEELKSLLMKVTEEESWLKTQHLKNEYCGIQSHHFMANRNNGNSDRLYFGAPKSLQMVTAAMKLKDTYSLEGKLWPT